MSKLKAIKAPVAEEMRQFEGFFKGAMASKVPLLGVITNYILRRKGKQMRPLLVFLTARLTGETNKSTFYAASFIELLHTATLIHDDVVDESFERRGNFSINALWRAKIAVLVGDYLLSKGMLLAIEHEEFGLLRIVSQAVREMSEGELLQIQKARKMNINEETYFEVIRMKTATLIAACTASGAKSVDAPEENVQKMKQFGEALGIAFQIKDDLFDYSKTNAIGKPTANDIKEKKMTLPLIYALEQAPANERAKIIRIVKHHRKNARKVEDVIAFVKRYGGLEYAESKMIAYKQQANDILAAFPESETRDALMELVDFVVHRKK